MRRLTAVAAAVALSLALTPGVAIAAKDPPPPGQTTARTISFEGSDYSYLVYTPTTYTAGKPAPLLVVVHGCQTTAEAELYADRFTPVAEREGLVLLYPDVDAVGRALPGPLNNCWKFFLPQAYVRDDSDPGAIEAMTRTTMSKLSIDPERVYIAGISAGGLMEAVDAADYPELYAAEGNIESAGYLDGFCFTDGIGIPVELSAQLAFAQMGSRARVVPRFVITSNGDLAFPANCGDKAMEQSLRTNNLVLSGSQTGPLALTPAEVRPGQVPGGRSYKVSTYRDPAGCVVGEKTVIDGMPHSWPGGTADPAYNSDENAPSGAEIAWAFFKRFTKSSTAMPCAEAPPAPRCPARWVLVRLPAGAHAVSATVNGRRAGVRRARGGVRVHVPAGAGRLAVRARSRGGKRLTRTKIISCARLVSGRRSVQGA